MNNSKVVLASKALRRKGKKLPIYKNIKDYLFVNLSVFVS
jgi:hypothetical protein